jgi:hypothetical protein
MELMSKIFNKVKEKIIYSAGYLDLIDIDGYKAVRENDMVVCIPYLVESNQILLRYENVPTFELIKPEVSKYINVMSKVIGTTPVEALREGLAKEFGIVLKDDVSPEILTPIFINKGNTARYHICILPLMSYQYEQTRPEDNATLLEMRDNNAILNITELNNIIVYDLITRYCLDLFKKSYSLF